MNASIEDRDAPRIVIFDGVCNLCSRAARFVIRHDRAGRFRFAPAQSDAGRRLLVRCGQDPDRLETFVLIKDGRACLRSDAALAIVRELDRPWPALGILRLVPRPWRDALYDLIARRRYRWFGRRDACLTPTADIRARFLE